MDIQATKTRGFQNRLGKNLPISDDNGEVCLKACEDFTSFRSSDFFGLVDGEPEFLSGDFDRRRTQLHITTSRAIRLGENCTHLMGAAK